MRANRQIKIRQYFCVMSLRSSVGGVWRSKVRRDSDMALFKYFSRVPTLPAKVPSLSEKELERTNADVKQAFLEHSFRLSVPLQRKIIDTSIDNERTAAGKWAGRFGYVRHDVISRKTKNRQIKIRQLESETNPPNLIPAKFSGYTVYKNSNTQLHFQPEED